MYRDCSHDGNLAAQSLMTRDRRSDARRPCHATVWLLDEELLRATEFGAVADISRGGIRIVPLEDADLRAEAWRPGFEWLVMIDDPTATEPLADQRAAIIRLQRADRDPCGRLQLACTFVTRRVGRCGPGRERHFDPQHDVISDRLAGDMLDELAEGLRRELTAQLHALEE